MGRSSSTASVIPMSQQAPVTATVTGTSQRSRPPIVAARIATMTAAVQTMPGV
jgi:hypothetical protein